MVFSHISSGGPACVHLGDERERTEHLATSAAFSAAENAEEQF